MMYGSSSSAGDDEGRKTTPSENEGHNNAQIL